jgi:hypothetical protein
MACRSILAVALAAVSAFAGPASAQEQRAPVAMPAVPTHNCVKPESVGPLASQAQIRTFNRAYAAYSECIKKYADAAKALSDAALAAGNKAIEEYNTLAAELKAQNEAAK